MAVKHELFGTKEMEIPESQTFSPETLREFDEISAALAQLFKGHATEDEDFEIDVQSATGCSIDFYIKNYEVMVPSLIVQRLEDIQTILRSYKQFWCVRFWVYKPSAPWNEDDTSIWLEIDKYHVVPYLGKKEIQIFDDMDAFYANFWGKGTRAP